MAIRTVSALAPYLAPSDVIDTQHPEVASLARELGRSCASDEAIAQRCFEFVRDSIKHSWDLHREGPGGIGLPVTCRASEVLLHRTGFCYSKSHLLAALLRVNGLPAGLCYQRLTVGTQGPPFCLHGLNAVYLERYGWYRLDARGNKPGVAAAFTPPFERLAFPVVEPDERDFDEIWPEPLPVVLTALRRFETVEALHEHLPDIEVAPRPPSLCP